MSEHFIEHWRQVAEFDYPALQIENERLTGMHRKAVAEAAILLAEKADRDEEIERLRKTLAEAKESVLTSLNLVDDASSTLRISWQKLLLAQTKLEEDGRA